MQNSSIFLSTIVLGELAYGADYSREVAANRKKVEAVSQRATILAVSRVTAGWYGRIKTQLRSIGRPIPDNDAWIAATAMEHGLTLATRDSHFDHVDGLCIARW